MCDLLDSSGGSANYAATVTRLLEILRRQDRWLRRGVLALLLAAYAGYALWGIAAPFAWGHYGYHGGFHGAAARNLSRHGVFTPTPHIGQSSPPDKSGYLHHPIVCPQYLVPLQGIFGDHEWVIRVVPVVFTLAALLLVVAVGRRFWGEWGGLLAGVVFVLLPHNMVFCHLYDHETPGMVYTLAGVAGFLSFLRQPRWPAAVWCLAGFGLAGLTDWPPYFIAFATAWAGFGYLLAATVAPHRPWRVLVWLAGIGLAGAAGHWALTTKVHWPGWMASIAVFCLMVGALLPAADVVPRRPSVRLPRPILYRWGLVAGLCAMAMLTFWFHFKYTAWVGMSEDLRQAFKIRTGSPDAWRYAGKYFNLVRHSYTTPVLCLAGAWMVSLPARLALGRPLMRATLPMVFLTGQLMHNLKFPGEVDIHNYRTYYFVIAASFMVLDLIWEVGALARWLTGRVFGPHRPHHATLAAAGLVTPLILVVVGWQAAEALPVLREGRARSGTLLYRAPYSTQLDKARFFDEVRRRTSPRTLVLYTHDVAPRFEALWYLDRDYHKVFTIPRDQRTALSLGHRAALRLQRHREGRRLGRRPRPPSHRITAPTRPVVALVPARLGRRHRAAFERVLLRHPVSRIGDWYLIDYQGRGPSFRAWRMSTRRRAGWLSGYLRGPHGERVLGRDLHQEWRTLSRYGLPVAGQVALSNPPNARAGRYDWVAYHNARRAAGDDAGVARARKALTKRLKKVGKRPLSPELILRGVVMGHTTVELFVQATRTHAPACRLRIDAQSGRGRHRRGRTLAVFPELERWLDGVIYIVRYPLHLHRGRHRLTLQPCVDDGPPDAPAAYDPIPLGAVSRGAVGRRR